MSVVAWDGKVLAADKRCVCGGLATTTTKVRRIQRPGLMPELLAWTGDQDSGEMLAAWYADGADPARWPECQKDNDRWSRLIVVDVTGCRVFERQPIGVKVEDPFSAWGSGRDLALVAMYYRKSASEAVAVACLFDTGCGNGIDVLTLT